MRAAGRRTVAATAAVFTLVVVFLISGGWFVHRLVAGSIRTSSLIAEASTLAAGVLKTQLDEETGLRGYAATGDRVFLQPYYAGRRSLFQQLARLTDLADRLGMPAVRPYLTDAAAVNAGWNRTVAAPLLRTRSRNATAVQLHGKRLIDRFRADVAHLEAGIDARELAADSAVQHATDRVAIFVGLAIVLVGLLSVIFLIVQQRLAGRLEQARATAEDARRRTAELRAAYLAEKRIADTLQGAFAQRDLPTLPTLRFSATYVPATEETKVGGDWYDALELPESRVLFAIGDVAGHGIDAAVTMNRARQALISAALIDADPASVLGRVNTELLRERAPMVTAVAGFADARTYEFVYSTAGHPPPLLVEPGRAPRLLDCGGVPLGVVKASYSTYRIQTVPGATLVLYTDGAVEHSRNVIEGEEQLLAAAAMAAYRGDSDPASVIHNAIFQGRPVGDDVAILTVAFADDRSSGMTISADNAQQAFVGRLGGKARAVEPALPAAAAASTLGTAAAGTAQRRPAKRRRCVLGRRNDTARPPRHARVVDRPCRRMTS